MASAEVTFTLDELALQRLEAAASIEALPKNEVVSKAIIEHYERLGRLSAEETKEKLRIFDELVPKIPRRPQEEVDREIAEVRLVRRLSGRRTR